MTAARPHPCHRGGTPPGNQISAPLLDSAWTEAESLIDKRPLCTVLKFSVVSWRILRVSFEAYVSNEQPLAEKTRMSSSLLNTSLDSTAS